MYGQRYSICGVCSVATWFDLSPDTCKCWKYTADQLRLTEDDTTVVYDEYTEECDKSQEWRHADYDLIELLDHYQNRRQRQDRQV